MGLVDYRGFRVSAVAQLPIGKTSLVYGSADGTASWFLCVLVSEMRCVRMCVTEYNLCVVTIGGKTVHAIASVNSAIAYLGRKLNLKPHDVAGADGVPVQMAMPGDIGTTSA